MSRPTRRERQLAGTIGLLSGVRDLHRSLNLASLTPSELAQLRDELDETLPALHRLRRRLDGMTATCVKCGEMFTPGRSDALYCSASCKQRAYTERRLSREDQP